MDAKDYFHRGESKPLEEAIEDYSIAITLDMCYTAAYRARGNTYLALDDKDKALDDLNKAIELDPLNDALWNDRAWIKECIKQGSGQKDYTHSCFLRGVKLYVKGDYDSALDHFSTVVNTTFTHALAWYYRGLCSEERGELNLALEDYTKAIVVNPYFGEAYNRRGNLNSQLGDQEKALDDYARAVGIEHMFP